MLVLLKTNYTDLAGLITIIMRAGSDQHRQESVLGYKQTHDMPTYKVVNLRLAKFAEHGLS